MTVTFNAPLAKRALRHIERHRDEWYQQTWHCGSQSCFAGHVTILSGGVFIDWRTTGKPLDVERVLAPDGSVVHCSDYAVAQLVRSTDFFGDYAKVKELEIKVRVLFRPANTLDFLRAMIQELANTTDGT